MATDTSVLDQIANLVNQLLSVDNQYFLVDVKVKPTQNFKVYIDGDKGVDIDECIKINRALRAQMEEAEMFPDRDFSLEVSSPGLDNPLKLPRQYTKNMGRLLEVTFLDEEKEPFIGKITDVTDDGVVLEVTTGKGKKAETHSEAVAFDQIKKAIIQIQF